MSQDSTFLDVLGKLKENINKFDEQDVEESKNSQYQIN
jgi:hypothetical protein